MQAAEIFLLGGMLMEVAQQRGLIAGAAGMVILIILISRIDGAANYKNYKIYTIYTIYGSLWVGGAAGESAG